MKAASAAGLVVLLLFLSTGPANSQFARSAANASQEVGGLPVNGLQMSISYDTAAVGRQSGMQIVLIITLRNLTSRKMGVLLGGGCNAKAISKTMGVSLNLTGADGRPHRNLPFLGDGPPYQAGCAGGMYISVVTLQPASSQSFPLDLSKYFDLSSSNRYAETRFPAGMYAVQAELVDKEFDDALPHLTTARMWTGKITSNALRIRFDKDFGVLFGD